MKLDIDPSSVVYWNGEAMPDRQTLESKIYAAAQRAVQPEVHPGRTRAPSAAIVAGVMAASAQQLGLTKVGIVGGERFINE